jgi:hypothetical protein
MSDGASKRPREIAWQELRPAEVSKALVKCYESEAGAECGDREEEDA